MNRRDFIGVVSAGVATANAANAAPISFGAPAPAASQPQGEWLKQGLIDAGGSHEPYTFMVRRGGERRDVHEFYERQQSEELIRQLRDQGIEVFHTHLYKGFGMAAEMPEMEDTKRAAAIAHRYGMRVDTYIQWGTMMYETFFAEEPRAQQWIQRDAFGRPVMTTYGYQQSFRYQPCFSNQDYLNYLKKIVRYAVEEVKTDFIHFDNFLLNPEPDSCHCPACTTGFRNRLQTKYSPEQRKERFGFTNVDYVNPPQWNKGNPPEKMQIIFDPAFQEWIDYRSEEMSAALKQMADYIGSMNTEVAIEINCGGITGENLTWAYGIDHARLMKTTNVVVTEEDNPPDYLPDGRLISTIRTYKMARRFGNIVLAFPPGSEAATGESLAFNQTIGIAAYASPGPLAPGMLKYVSYYRKYRDYYVRADDAASVALLRSYPSLTYHNSQVQLSTILIEQALIQSKVPFHLIFDEHMEQLSPALCKVLILPDTECLSDAELAAIRRFVEADGGLIATEQAGLYDEWRRLRVKPGLEGLVENQAPALDYEETVEASAHPSGLPTRREVGRGRVVYIPGIEFDGPLPAATPYFAITEEFWKRPKNWQELIDAVRWAARGHVLIEVTGPDYLVANLVEQRDKQRRLVHLLNYNTRRAPRIEGIDVKCEVPEGQTPKHVTLYSPDFDGAQSLIFELQGSRAAFTVPELRTYSMVVVDW